MEIESNRTSKMRKTILFISQLERLLCEYLKKIKIDKDESFEKLAYGINVKSVIKGGKVRPGIIMLDCHDKEYLVLLNKFSKDKVTRIKITSINQISLDTDRGNFTQLTTEEIKNHVALFSIAESMNFIFFDKIDLDSFLCVLYERLIDITIHGSESAKTILKVWRKYDNDFSKELEYNEFKQFIHDFNIMLDKESTLQELFDSIDKNKSGKIDYNEFVEYYEKLNNGEEFQPVFRKYSHDGNFMNIHDLIKFYKEEQKEEISQLDAIDIIKSINEKITENQFLEIIKKIENIQQITPNDLIDFEINLSQFKNIITNNNISNIRNVNLLNNFQDMERPLNEYLIYSSHNTYLTGHQLYGESSVEMYNYAMNVGCRLVEIDIWDGENNEPIVTHGFTFTSKLLFKDVLSNIKKTAFLVSEYPVILTIENHCSKKQQIVMKEYLNTILEDLFIIDPDEHQWYPSPNDLKNKFILRFKRPRLFKRNPDPEKLKIKQENLIEKKKSLAKSAFFKSKNSKLPEERKKSQADILMNIQQNTSTNILPVEEDKNEEAKENDFRKKKKGAVIDLMEDLHKIISMIIIKFKIEQIKDTNYQPWDSVSIKCKKVESLVKDFEKRKLLVELTNNAFVKTYPITFDSSNFDPVKSWIVGIQIAAMNLQVTTDDFTLLNTEFFKINRNCGYILKPKFLRTSQYEKDYKNPLFTLRFELLAGFMLQFLLSNIRFNDKTMKFETYIIGSYEDDKNNQRYETMITYNFMNPKFSKQVYEFKIYEDYLSFIFVKITVNDELVGRCVIPLWIMCEGYRTITIYDNYGREYNDSHLICYIRKE